MSLASVIGAQRRWAKSLWTEHQGPESPSIEANLFQPLSPATRAEFATAGGDELGLSGRRAKMRSLRSSSALACNVFDAWRGSELETLAFALGLSGHFIDFHFERRCPHGLNSEPPNLDLVFYPSSGTPVGIESKFTEPYGAHKPNPALRAKYFKGSARRWEAEGLLRCQVLAENLGTVAGFSRLDAGQLLKHLLGLVRLTENRSPPRLLYLWFDSGGREADKHRDELDRFASALDPAIGFSERTYQDVFNAMLKNPEPKPGYLKYLEHRYFGTWPEPTGQRV